jgi:hypothetical protein
MMSGFKHVECRPGVDPTVGAGIMCAPVEGMAHRQFLDDAGLEWTVYDVNPRADERRYYDRRDSSQDVNGSSPLDRRADDRRATVGAVRSGRLTRGWLCFESQQERRRLQPIPENWHHLSDAELADLLQQARVAPRRVS